MRSKPVKIYKTMIKKYSLVNMYMLFMRKYIHQAMAAPESIEMTEIHSENQIYILLW